MKKLRESPWLCGASAIALLLAGAPGARADAPAGASLGTLEYGANLYSPQGCQHNGSTVVCTFQFVHQAETQTLRAGGGGSQLTGIEFVDDAHVPHKPNNAYFVDRYGTRQHVLVMNRADQGTMMVEFPLVDAHVTSGQLQLGTQVLGGIPVTALGATAAPAVAGAGAAAAAAAPIRTAAAPMAPAAAAPAAAGTAAAPAGGATPIAATTAAGASVQNTCNTPALANTQGCKLNTKIHQAEVSGTNTATSIAAPVSAMGDAAKQISGLFSGFRAKPAVPAAAAATAQPVQPAAAAPAQQPTQTQ